MEQIKNRFTGEIMCGGLSLNAVLEKHAKWGRGEEGGERANLSSADLRRANLHEADLCGANLREANLCGANLCSANLYGANLRRANLCGANLCSANLYGADLRRANLCSANLSGADLSFADLSFADLYGEKLKMPPIQLSGLRWFVLITAEYMSIGCERHTHEEWASFKRDMISQMAPQAWDWWNAYKPMLLALCEAHRKEAEASK